MTGCWILSNAFLVPVEIVIFSFNLLMCWMTFIDLFMIIPIAFLKTEFSQRVEMCFCVTYYFWLFNILFSLSVYTTEIGILFSVLLPFPGFVVKIILAS